MTTNDSITSSVKSLTKQTLGGFTSSSSFNYINDLEATLIRSSSPIEIEETEEITVLGERGLWLNKNEAKNWHGEIPLANYQLNRDSNPEIIFKKNDKNLDYIQELSVRYLKPPSPQVPGEIVIKYEKNGTFDPAPPIIMRQQPSRPKTPEPLIIREAPPTPPSQIEKKVITISGKKLPPPPRKIIIERLPETPPKPQSILIERWLPYKRQKRKVVVQHLDNNKLPEKPRNLIIQWDQPTVTVKKHIKHLGVISADPKEYHERFGKTLYRSEELPMFVKEIKNPDGLNLATDFSETTCELIGDVEALKLVDLDKEGLSEYKSQIENFCSKSSYKTIDSDCLEVLFKKVDKNSDGAINKYEAKQLLSFLNKYLEKKLCDEILDRLVEILDYDQNNNIIYQEFKKIYEKFF